MLRVEPRHRGGLQQHQREQATGQGDLALLAVGLAPIEQQEHPEDRQDQPIAHQRPDDAADRVRGGGAATQQLLVQRQQPLVRLVGHDLVRADNAVPRSHDVLAGVHAAAQLVATPFGLETVQDQCRREELAHELEVQHVAHARPRVRVKRLGAIQVLREGQHLITHDGRLVAATADDDFARLLHLEHGRPGDPQGQGAVEQGAQRLLQRPALAALGQIDGFLECEGYAKVAAGLQDSLRPLLGPRIHGVEERPHRRGGGVVGALAELVNRFRRRRQLLRLPLQLVLRLVHHEVEGRDDFLGGAGPGREEGRDVRRARGESDVREHREAEHPDPSRTVIADLLVRGEVHVNPARPRRRLG
jgi:hypothetical protein